MKTRKLFIAMALPALLAACSQDEFVNENKFAEVPQLADGFKLNAEKVMGAQTKGTWAEVDGNFVYKWDIETAAASTTENLGLCWTGKVGDTEYTQQASKNLFTNYKFVISKASDTKKEDGTLDSPVSVGAAGEGYKKYAEFTTTASSLFAGEYVVYYPYTESFNEVGYIKAAVKNTFKAGTAATKTDMYKAGGSKMFMMSGRTAMNAGQTSENFELSAKSTLLRMDLWMAAGETAVNVDKIILFDNTGLASEMKYNADGSVVEGSVKYDHKTMTGQYKSGGIVVAASTDAEGAPFVLPMLNVDLKSTTVIYIHATTGKWAKKAFTKAYKMEAGVMPLEIKDLKAADFNLDLVTDANELKDAIENNAKNIDILTDITLNSTALTPAWTWNATKDVTIKSASGAKLIFDVKDGNVELGGADKAINFDCDVEVKDSGAEASANTFTLACGSTISGTFTNNIADATFEENVTIAEEGEVVNSGTLKLTAAKTLTVLGDVTNNEEATIEIVANAALNVSGRNAQVTNNGNLDNSGTMTITKYTGNSVVNNGVAIVNETGTFEGDFDTTSTGVFWKKAANIVDLNGALTKSYSKIILSGTFDFSAATAATVLEAGDKDIEFADGATITMPSTADHKNFTLNTTGTVTIKNAVTLGASVTNAPVVTIKAGAVKAEANLTVEKSGILTVTGDIDATSAEVKFKNGSTVSFANFNNNGGASLTLENGANVTYTGKINLIPAN